MRTRTPRILLATIACAALLFTAGCGDNDKPNSGPTRTTSSASPTPSPTKPAWESQYTEQELEAYTAAVNLFAEYEEKSEPIWAAGKVTPEAELFFKQYWFDFSTPLDRLAEYERFQLQLDGIAKVLWSKPKTIQLANGSAGITLEQCIDPSTIKLTNAGTAAPPASQKPYVRTIRVDKGTNGPYRISGLIDITSGKKLPECGP